METFISTFRLLILLTRLNRAGYPHRLICRFIVFLPRLVMSHHVLAIFFAAAYFSHRGSLYTGSS